MAWAQHSDFAAASIIGSYFLRDAHQYKDGAVIRSFITAHAVELQQWQTLQQTLDAQVLGAAVLAFYLNSQIETILDQHPNALARWKVRLSKILTPFVFF